MGWLAEPPVRPWLFPARRPLATEMRQTPESQRAQVKRFSSVLSKLTGTPPGPKKRQVPSQCREEGVNKRVREAGSRQVRVATFGYAIQILECEEPTLVGLDS